MLAEGIVFHEITPSRGAVERANKLIEGLNKAFAAQEKRRKAQEQAELRAERMEEALRQIVKLAQRTDSLAASMLANIAEIALDGDE